MNTLIEKRLKELEKQCAPEDLVTATFSDGSTQQMSMHDAIIAALKATIPQTWGMQREKPTLPHLVDIVNHSSLDDDGFIRAILVGGGVIEK